MKATSLILAFAIAAVPVAARAAALPAYAVAAVAAPDRPAADTARDALRHPAELVAFAGIKPGDQVADIMPGKGYFTRIFANAVGPKGAVYAIVPSELAKVAPKIPEAMKALAADPAFPNIKTMVMPAAATTAPVPLDVAWTSDNYHDLYGFFGAAQAAAFDAAVFKALKPGGVFIVIDHIAPRGSAGADATTLHRIDPETVKAQVLAAGFKLTAESSILANASDSHTAKVFDPAIRGHTDQFVFKFTKP